MKQVTLATGTGFELHTWPTRKADFLAKKEGLLPWAELYALIEPHYPKASNGRPLVGLERMLRLYWAANVHDSHEAPNLLRGNQPRFDGDSACRGKAQRGHLKEIISSFRLKSTPLGKFSTACAVFP